MPMRHHRDHWVLGDPTSRRVADYRAAATDLGLPSPRCLDWWEVITEPQAALDRLPNGTRLRIDSFGQRDAVIAALIRRGNGSVIPLTGEIRSLDHQYIGLCRILRDIERWAASRPDIHLDRSPSEIAMMFDKWATHERMRPHRPDAVLVPTEVDDIDELIRALADRFGGRFFLKPRTASSASGVCRFQIRGDRWQVIAPIQIDTAGGTTRLFNSLRICSFTAPAEIHTLLTILLPQGMIAEAEVNKVRIEGDPCDLRFVVIDGRADHMVIRQSASPMTNLHLGNARGSVPALIDAVGRERVEACRRLAVWAASQFPQSAHPGVDILLPRRGEPIVCEVNAFGDFLPNLTANGQSVYESILLAAERNAARTEPRSVSPVKP